MENELIALLAAAVLWWLRQRRQRGVTRAALTAQRARDDAPPGADGTWVWPLPRTLGGAAPVISDPWGSPRPYGGHRGVDVMYRRPRTLPVGTTPPPGESRGFYVPAGESVVAVHSGRVWSVRRTRRGWEIVIDHGPEPWSTYYLHMESVALPLHTSGRMLDAAGRAVLPPVSVEAGQPLGIVGSDPLDHRRVRHVHFELRHGKTPVDPGPAMERWGVVD